ncbi:unnamed protein product [Diatraea saccharalis]|uniref:FLYWCH-type domain-containing protein n=1 Tax=Diatraea saccharalis TaxID=40085 RepID=A0A9N9R0F5_9NEOP|nr:unnamed protein product [Diatraea saccharalis]
MRADRHMRVRRRCPDAARAPSTRCNYKRYLDSMERVPAVYVPSRTGKSLLLHDGYTFYLKNLQAHGRKQWYCSSRDMAGCRADVITAPANTGNGDVLFLVRGRHIHGPPNYYFTPDEPFFVTSRRGNPMIIYEGMNFIRERTINGSEWQKTRWVCGRKRRLKCIATVTTLDGVVIKKYGHHNHS